MRRFQSHNSGLLAISRLTILSIVIFLIAGVIIIRLLVMQVFQHAQYLAVADNQHVVEKELYPSRGSIYIHDYESGQNEVYPVAINKKFYLLYAVPSLVKNPLMTVKILTPVLGLAEEEAKTLGERLSKEEDIYEPIKHKLPEDKKKEIEALNLEGVNFEEEIVRFYPEGETTAQITGFVGYKGDNLVGQYGVEGYFQKELAGEKGSFLFERDAFGRLIPLARRVKADQENGSDIILTLDRSIQFTACNALKTGVVKHGAQDGSVIIMDPKTGAVLAMCGYPSFDPNNYNEVTDYSVYNNYNVSEPYEPGSMFKAITMAAALDVGAVTPNTTYEDLGFIKIGGYTIKNSDGKAHGIKNMTQVLEESLNTGAIFAAQQVGLSLFRNYFDRFGFGLKTGIQLEGENEGNISAIDVAKKSEISMFTASYGQGITATPLQIISAFSAIANGGKLMKPFMVDEIKHSGGKVEKFEPQFLRQVITQKTATTLSAMLASVVKSGHAQRAQIPGYYIAGKTGTAQVAEGGKYATDKTIHSFIGFAPIEDPRFVMLVKLNHPKGVAFAESSVVPVFKEISQFLLNYLKIPPAYEVMQKP
ncbi:MAG: penicillin-binding protein 2 [Patescibacteria group bacterium]|jgi:cell division protein FtsI/penicillin-binding protein 2